jgi:hypothetical protein
LQLHQFYTNKNFFGHTNPHDSPHNTLFGVDDDEAFVDTHFPPIPGCGSFAAWSFTHRNPKSFGGQRMGARNFDACFLGDGFQFPAYVFKLLVVSAGQFDSRLSYHRQDFLLNVAFIDSLSFKYFFPYFWI